MISTRAPTYGKLGGGVDGEMQCYENVCEDDDEITKGQLLRV